MAEGQKMHSRHSVEWAAYSADYRATKVQIEDKQRGRTALQRARKEVKEQFKPLRSQLGKQQWAETKAFEKKEHRVAGKLENALAAIRYAKELGRDNSKGFASMAFNFLTSKKSRASALNKHHSAQWKNLNAGQAAQTDIATTKVKADQQRASKDFRGSFASRRQMLKDKQDAERATLQRKWATRKLERNRSFEVVRQQTELKKHAMNDPEKARDKAKAKVKFNEAAKGQRARRSRSRKRNL